MPYSPVRKRYIAFKLLSDTFIYYNDLSQSIRIEILKLHGDFGVSKAGFKLIEYDGKTGFGIVKCNHLALEQTRLSLLSLKNVRDIPVIPQVLHVSGTIKSLRQKMKETMALST